MLKSFGCSFIYGSDLADCPHGQNELHPPPSDLTWPALLAQRLGLEYQCYARPAAGNLHILESLLSEVDSPDTSICVVNWTWIERFDFVSDAAKTVNHPWNPVGWCSLLPTDENEVVDKYYRHVHSQFRDKLETLICIKTAIDILQDREIKFLMTYTDDLIFETKWHTSPAVRCLQEYAQLNVHGFQQQGFYEWCKNQGFAISHRWHPLEQAHVSAAELMLPIIDAILRRA